MIWTLNGEHNSFQQPSTLTLTNYNESLKKSRKIIMNQCAMLEGLKVNKEKGKQVLTMAYGKLLFVHFMEYVKKRISFDML
jgi:hypothetical protein